MSKLVLIDGNAVLHRAYHALPPLATKKGEPINAVYGLVSMLLRVIMDLKPSHIAVAFDRPEPTFRQKEFPKYQAQRPPLDKDLSSQFAKAKDVFAAMNIPVYEMPGYEADDLLATLARRATAELDKNKDKPRKSGARRSSAQIGEVVIVTGDRDILQLVDDDKRISVYLPRKGLTDARLMREVDVVEKLGVKPRQIPDYKALVGDPSDNYPGVAGIGPKTAISLLKEFGTLENIYKNIEKIKSPIKDKLIEGGKNAFLFLKLARIVSNVDLNASLEDAKKWQVDSPQLLSLFSEFGFKTLTQRVKDVGKQIVSENQTSLF